MDKILDLTNMTVKQTMLLNKIAEENEQKYAELIDQFGQQNGNDMFWWATPLSSRNTYLSGSFLDICLLELCLRLVTREAVEEIVVPHAGLKKSLMYNLKRLKNENKIRVRCVQRKRDSQNQIFTVMAEIKNRLGYYFAVRKRDNKFEKDSLECMIDDYVLTAKLSRTGYQDGYLGELGEYADDKTAFIPVISNNCGKEKKKIIEELVENEEYRFVPMDYFLKFSDYFVIIRYALKCMKYLLGRKRYGEWDITSIINRDIYRGISAGNSYEGLLHYLFVKRLSERKFQIKTFFAWYEGQPHSNELFLAATHFYPKAKKIGYIGRPVFEFWGGTSPSNGQFEAGAAPDMLGVIGREFLEQTNRFCKEMRTKVMPAFGKRDLFQGRKNVNESEKRQKEILVVLCYSREMSKHLLRAVCSAKEQMKQTNICYVFKNHPVNSGLELKDYGIDDWDGEHRFVEGNLLECAKDKLLVITSNTSSGLEILAMGTKVIIVGEKGRLKATAIPAQYFDKYVFYVYEAGQIAETAQRILENPENGAQWSREILKDNFLPVTKESVAAMFEA